MDTDRVYVPLSSGNTVGIDRQSGALLWSRAINSPWPVMVGEGVVYLFASDNELWALDAATGATLWARTQPTHLLTAPVYVAGRLVLVLDPGDYVSLRASDGLEQWRLRIGNDAPLFPPVAGADFLFVSLDGGDLAAIAAADGRLVWRRTIGGRLSVPAWAPDRVFVGSTDNYLYALDPDDGDLEWRWRAGGDVIGAAPDADGGVSFASLDNILRRLNQGNGNQRWREEIPTRPAVAPQAIANLVVITGVAPIVAGFGGATGLTTGNYAAPAEILGPALVDDDLRPFRVGMVVLTRDGRLVGLTPVAAMYRDPPLTPLDAMPGTRLSREPAP
jgi:outer membrane protein assembly factor BamB